MKENLKFVALGFLPVVFGIIGMHIFVLPVFLFCWGYIGYRNYAEDGLKTYLLLHLPLIIALVISLTPLVEVKFLSWYAEAFIVPFFGVAYLINEMILGLSTVYVGFILTFIIVSFIFFVGRELAKAEWGFVR